MAQLAMVQPINTADLEAPTKLLKRRPYSGEQIGSPSKRSRAFLNEIMFLEPYERVQQIHEQERKLQKMDMLVAEKRQEAFSLWSRGLLEESLGEMVKSETLLARLVKEIRSLVLLKAYLLRQYDLSEKHQPVSSDDSYDAAPVSKKRKSVKFSDEPDQIIGTADPEVDRHPISVEPASLAERLLIRCARDLPMGPNMMGLHC